MPLWKVTFTALKVLAENFVLLCCLSVFMLRVQNRVQFLLKTVAISAECMFLLFDPGWDVSALY